MKIITLKCVGKEVNKCYYLTCTDPNRDGVNNTHNSHLSGMGETKYAC
jgi:hypothetical protein